MYRQSLRKQLWIVPITDLFLLDLKQFWNILSSRLKRTRSLIPKIFSVCGPRLRRTLKIFGIANSNVFSKKSLWTYVIYAHNSSIKISFLLYSLEKAKQVVKQKKLQASSSYTKKKTDEGTLVIRSIISSSITKQLNILNFTESQTLKPKKEITEFFGAFVFSIVTFFLT